MSGPTGALPVTEDFNDSASWDSAQEARTAIRWIVDNYVNSEGTPYYTVNDFSLDWDGWKSKDGESLQFDRGDVQSVDSSSLPPYFV